MGNDDKRHAEKSLARLLVQAARAHRNRLSAMLAAQDLVAGQEQVLQALSSNGPLSMGELATLLHVRPPTVSKTISRLTGLGLVKRLPAKKEDGRITQVVLTAAGEAKAKLVDILWLETEAELLTGFDSKDRKRLRKMLRRAIGNLSTGGTQPEENGSGEDSDIGR